MWFILCVVVISVVYIHSLFLRRKLKDFPAPPSLPLIGNSLELMDLTKILKTLSNYKENYGDMVRFQIHPWQNHLLVSDYDFLKYLLSSQEHITKSTEYDLLVSWIGRGLLTSSGNKWKSHRRIITPAFHFSILESFVDLFEANANILVDKMKSEVNQNSVNIHPYIKFCTLDIICETAMGTKINAQLHGDSEYVKAVENMTTLIMQRITSGYKSIDRIYKLTEDYRRERKMLGILHHQTRTVIEERKKQKELNGDEKIIDEETGKKKKIAFIDVLLREENNLSFEEIREEVDTFMFEGHDTTSSAIDFAIYTLANRPDIQDKIIEEQKSILGDDLKNQFYVTYAQLQEMRYLEAFIKEVLRLYPTVSLYSRLATRDIVFKDKCIPKNTRLWIFAYGIHRDPQYFPNPEHFDPERFLGQENKAPYAYLPFSAGPRNCIGQKFAMLTAKSIISKILRNYILMPSIPQKTPIISFEVVLKSVNGINIRWIER